MSLTASIRGSSTSRFSRNSIGQITEPERKCLEIQSLAEQAKSKFDLPLEYHTKTYEEWLRMQPAEQRTLRNSEMVKTEREDAFAKYRLSQKTSIMYLCNPIKPIRKSRFENLRTEVLINALDARPKFYAYRKMAIELLKTKISQKLKIIGENEACSTSVSSIPERVFSWSAEDYYHRRSLNNVVWLEVYERDCRQCMEEHKFKFDLEELGSYIAKIFCGALIRDPKYSFDAEVMQPLEDASDLLSAYECLHSELNEHRKICAEFKEQLSSKATSKGNMHADSIADATVLYPIIYRYQKSWYTAQADQVEKKTEDDFRSYREEIAGWITKIQEENSVVNNALNIYYTTIECYKTKINEYTEKFDREFDELENAISYMKLSMTKLEVQRANCNEQMAMFEAELEERRIRKLAEAEEKHRLAVEAAERELMKLDAKDQKADIKARGKDNAKNKNKNKITKKK